MEMAEYIEREAAMLTPVLPKEHRHYQTSNLDDAYEQGWKDALDNLKNAPAADVAPVRHGHWIEGDGCQVCSECGEEHCWDEYRATYCDSCGARMDRKDNYKEDKNG